MNELMEIQLQLEIDTLRAMELPDNALYFDCAKIYEGRKDCPLTDEEKDEFRSTALNALRDGEYLASLEKRGYEITENNINQVYTVIKG